MAHILSFKKKSFAVLENAWRVGYTVYESI